jgi:branched-subunit amino acid ABC-type transport system permease component
MAHLAFWISILIIILVTGSEITLATLSFSLTYGAVGFANFCHVQFLPIGAYLALYFANFVPLIPAIVGAILATALLAVVIDQVVYRWLAASDPTIRMMASSGVALAIPGLLQLFGGVQSRTFQVTAKTINVFGASLGIIQIVVIATAVVVVAGFEILLKYSHFGRCIRAVAADRKLVEVRGINADLIVTGVWLIAGGMGALAGILLGMETYVQPMMGATILLPMFAAAVVGGLGSPRGAIVGAMILTGLQGLLLNVNFGTLFGFGSWVIGGQYELVIAFVLLVIALIIRPAGIVAVKELRA